MSDGLTFGSVCSGIEAASVAWHSLGWRAAWLAEVDRAASEVLAFRFPDVPNHGDMTLLAGKVRRREIPAPDVLVGGTPCQAFSIAGMRRGLDDERGQLTLSYVDLANAIDEIRIADGLPPVVIVWENVPGVLTSKDNAFGCFLAGIAGESNQLQPAGRKWTNAGAVLGPERAIAWRTLDAQWFGLAQRRRRVFVVASAREGFDPAAILLEFEGVRRDSAPSREAGEGLTHATAPYLTSSGRGVERTGDTRGQDPVVAVIGDGRVRAVTAVDVCPTLRAGGNSTGGNRPPGTDVDTADSLIVDLQNGSLSHVCGTLDAEGQARMNRGHGVLTPVPPRWDGRDVSQTLDAVLHKGQTMPEKNRFPAVLQPIQAYAFQPRIARNGRGDMGDVVNALTAQAGETGKGDAAPCVAVLPFDTTQVTSPGNYSSPNYGDPCHPLASAGHPPAVCVTEPVTHTLKADGFDASEDGTGRGQPITIAFQERGGRADGRVLETNGDLAYALTAPNGGGRTQERNILDGHRMAVRRLMPVECERLQGFPDNWTLVPTGKQGKLAADGPRYKQLGNSMATTVMGWIGFRIARHLATPMIGHNGGPPLNDINSHVKLAWSLIL